MMGLADLAINGSYLAYVYVVLFEISILYLQRPDLNRRVSEKNQKPSASPDFYSVANGFIGTGLNRLSWLLSADVNVRVVCFSRNSLSTAVPYWPNRRLGPAWTKTTTVPAPSVKARAAIPINRAVISRPLPFDAFGRTIAWQKAIAVPVTISHTPLSVHGRSKCCRN
jgi:hypothetical protein